MVCALVSLAGLAAIVWFLFQEGFPVLQHVSIKDFFDGPGLVSDRESAFIPKFFR